MSAFRRLGRSRLARGLLLAAAAYFVGNYFSGSEDVPDADANVPGGAPEPDLLAGGDAIDITTTPQPDITPTPTPEPPPVQAPQPQAQVQPVVPQPPPPSQIPAFQGASATGSVTPDDGIISSTAKWFKDLSPGAQQVLASSVAGGAAGLMQSMAQRNAQEDLREREQRAREDRERRGRIAAFAPNAFTPIISSRMGS